MKSAKLFAVAITIVALSLCWPIQVVSVGPPQSSSQSVKFLEAAGEAFDAVEAASMGAGVRSSEVAFEIELAEADRRIWKARRLASNATERETASKLLRWRDSISLCRESAGLHDADAYRKCLGDESKNRQEAMTAMGIDFSQKK